MEINMFDMLLSYIEQNIRRKLTIEDTAKAANISKAHLHRLFKFAYGITVSEYIRKRKLAKSLQDLLKTDFSVLEIALSYGFEYEQSFARAFKAEFGMSPGRYRKESPVVDIQPPFTDSGIKCSDGLLFGPRIMMLPQIRLVGTEHKIPYCDAPRLAPLTALDFWDHDRRRIPNGKENGIFYGLTHHQQENNTDSRYLTAVEVGKAGVVPEDMTSEVFGGYPCAKFHYIGRHHYRELSWQTACQMYEAIGNFYKKEEKPPCDIHLEKIDTNEYDGEYCLMEWFGPYSEKR